MILAAMRRDWYISWLGNYCEGHVARRPNQPLENTKYCKIHMPMKFKDFLDTRKLDYEYSVQYIEITYMENHAIPTTVQEDNILTDRNSGKN
jgi:hypothetical protein